MKNTKESIQKVSTFNGKKLFWQTKTRSAFEALSIPEQNAAGQFFASEFSRLYNSPDKSQAEGLLQHAKALFDREHVADLKRQLWGINHKLIQNAICDHVNKYALMPGSSELKRLTGLTRLTIRRHLRQFTADPIHAEAKLKFSFMTEKVLSKMLKLALHGDTRAAKIYLDTILPKTPSAAFIGRQQNNFISINGLRLDEKTLAALPPERLNQIADIIKSATIQRVEVVE